MHACANWFLTTGLKSGVQWFAANLQLQQSVKRYWACAVSQFWPKTTFWACSVALFALLKLQALPLYCGFREAWSIQKGENRYWACAVHKFCPKSMLSRPWQLIECFKIPYWALRNSAKAWFLNDTACTCERCHLRFCWVAKPLQCTVAVIKQAIAALRIAPYTGCLHNQKDQRMP